MIFSSCPDIIWGNGVPPNGGIAFPLDYAADSRVPYSKTLTLSLKASNSVSVKFSDDN